ncbi:MAG: hypothetical protein KIT86_00650 [Hydrogenophaga sp.]|uniref:hypothetical protein n=1 Tax=Hydrogenophaga sp. TaxID=1904254 RepID=UPI0026158EEC|nr:hypothetical protein [Hydrogenophaga sp.]MCW5668135.1 hypothetical protein [Hydrogenophaga sp.]
MLARLELGPGLVQRGLLVLLALVASWEALQPGPVLARGLPLRRGQARVSPLVVLVWALLPEQAQERAWLLRLLALG